jgi:hypothetical protein
MSEQKLASKTQIRSLSATTVPKKVCTLNLTRKGIYVQITDSGTAYITSAQNSAYTDGIKVTSSLPYENKTTTAELWILTSSSTAACIIQEDTN